MHGHQPKRLSRNWHKAVPSTSVSSGGWVFCGRAGGGAGHAVVTGAGGDSSGGADAGDGDRATT